jgi:uncharacterized membrane protein YiaA
MGEDFSDSTTSASPDNYIKFKALLIGTFFVFLLGIWLAVWEFVLNIDVPGFDIGVLIIALWILFVTFIARRRIDFNAILR